MTCRYTNISFFCNIFILISFVFILIVHIYYLTIILLDNILDYIHFLSAYKPTAVPS